MRKFENEASNLGDWTLDAHLEFFLLLNVSSKVVALCCAHWVFVVSFGIGFGHGWWVVGFVNRGLAMALVAQVDRALAIFLWLS